MKNLLTKLNQQNNGYIFRILSLLFFVFIISSSLYAQRGDYDYLDPGADDGEWISGTGKIYTLTGKVGIGTSSPERRLHLWGPSNRYFRITSEGGAQFSNAVAGVELQRRLDNGGTLNWDIVNQGTFKIRRNTNTLFILDEEEAQFGTQTEQLTLNIWGKPILPNLGQLHDGAIAIRSSNSGVTSTLRLDGSKIESENNLFINWNSDEDIKMAGVGNVAIGPIISDTGVKLGVKSDGWQFNLMNGLKSWRIGVSSDDWAVGDGKLVFSKTASSDAALMVLTEEGHVGIGETSPDRTLDVAGTTRTTVLEITGGADLAEPFSVAGASAIQPGTIVSIDPANAGQLKMAEQAYDKTVAGIISGAGDIHPGMVMGQDGSIASGEHPVALTGRVYARVDASYGAIQPGDLLTTSNTPGHAMKVSDASQAQGAIIGKAMTALEEGQGLVLVLVSLQ